jgi:hypothetical protein
VDLELIQPEQLYLVHQKYNYMNQPPSSVFIYLAQKYPYFTVLSKRKYRTLGGLDKYEFFRSGRLIGQQICRFFDQYSFTSCIDFGCGVGRILKTFPATELKYGVDVSPEMRRLTVENCRHCYTLSTDQLLLLRPKVDVVYSCITFQHIPEQEGLRILECLLSCCQKYAFHIVVKDERSLIKKLLWRISFLPILAGISNLFRLRAWSEPRIPMFCYNTESIRSLIQSKNFTYNIHPYNESEGWLSYWFYGKKK